MIRGARGIGKKIVNMIKKSQTSSANDSVAVQNQLSDRDVNDYGIFVMISSYDDFVRAINFMFSDNASIATADTP